MKHYIATILNMSENTTRTVNVDDLDVYKAHKRALLGNCSKHEEILKMHNHRGDEVFDLKKGFKGN